MKKQPAKAKATGKARAASPIRKASSLESVSWLPIALCLEWQYAIINRAYFDTLGYVKIPLAFGTGFCIDFKYDSAFGDGVGRAHRFAVAT